MANASFGSDLFLAELLPQLDFGALPLSLVEYILDFWLDRIGAQA